MGPMDPNLLLVLSALGTVSKGAASEAVKDAYHELRDLVRRKFAGKPQAETVLAQYEQQPEVWEAPLRAELIAADVPHDPEIVLAARQVMTLVQPQQAALGKFNNQITGNVQGLVQGDQAQVTLNFGEKPPGI